MIPTRHSTKSDLNRMNRLQRKGSTGSNVRKSRKTGCRVCTAKNPQAMLVLQIPVLSIVWGRVPYREIPGKEQKE